MKKQRKRKRSLYGKNLLIEYGIEILRTPLIGYF